MSINEFLAVLANVSRPESRSPSAPSGQLQASAKPQKANRPRPESPSTLAIWTRQGGPSSLGKLRPPRDDQGRGHTDSRSGAGRSRHCATTFSGWKVRAEFG
jgi:hypothetical protein